MQLSVGPVGLVAGGLLAVAKAEVAVGQCQGFRCLQKFGKALYLHPRQVLQAYGKVWSDLSCKSDYTHTTMSLRKHSCFCDEEARKIIPSDAALL